MKEDPLPEKDKAAAEQSVAHEKRRAPRIRLVCSASYQILEAGQPAGPIHSATTVDLSSNGALIRTTQPANLNVRLHLRLLIQLPGAKEAVRIIGRVVRVEEQEPAQKYLLGIAFEQFESPEQKGALLRLESMDLRRLLKALLELKGSDLHLTAQQSPIARVRGHLVPMKWPEFQEGEIQAMLYSIMTESQISAFEKQRELDFAHSLSLTERFRVNLHWQRGQAEAAIRVIPAQVRTWDELELPKLVTEWARKPNGLILIAGPTGSGKTTTLNAMVDQINKERDAVIICLERPIEYVHKNIKAVIKQREVGSDTLSYAEAVRRALRQDPDVIVVGEIEDAETAQVVLNASETGNLVFASFHATNTVQAIDRFLSLCPPQMREQVCFQLSSCLQGIMTQYLLPREEVMGGGVVLATEVFVPTDAARNQVRNDELDQLFSLIQTGVSYQMHTLEHSVHQLVTKGLVAQQIAESYLALAGHGPRLTSSR